MEWDKFYWYLEQSVNHGSITPDQYMRTKAEARQAQLDGKTFLAWLGSRIVDDQAILAAQEEQAEELRRKAIEKIRERILELKSEYQLEIKNKRQEVKYLAEYPDVKYAKKMDEYNNYYAQQSARLAAQYKNMQDKLEKAALKKRSRRNNIRKFFGLPYTP